MAQFQHLNEPIFSSMELLESGKTMYFFTAKPPINKLSTARSELSVLRGFTVDYCHIFIFIESNLPVKCCANDLSFTHAVAIESILSIRLADTIYIKRHCLCMNILQYRIRM